MKGFRIIVWLVSLVVFTPSCKKGCQEGEGDAFTESREYNNFHTFQLDIPGEVEIFHDTSLTNSRVVLLAQENVLKKLKTEVNSGILSVSFEECFENHSEITFRLYSPSLRKLMLNSSCRVRTVTGIYRNEFEVINNSTANANLSMKVDTFTWKGAGSSEVAVYGYARGAYMEVQTLGTINAVDLITDTCRVLMSGSGDISAYATSYLNVKIRSAGTVRFGGEDTLKIDSVLTGTGKLIDQRF